MTTARDLLLAGLARGRGLPGCIEQRYVIESDPPGALVLVNGQPSARRPSTTISLIMAPTTSR